MLAPKTTSSVAQFKKSAIAAAGVGNHLIGARLVTNAPPVLAL